MSKLKMIDLIYFHFISFSYLELRVGVSMMSYITVTNCYKSWLQKDVKGSRVIMSYHMSIVG